MDDKMRVKVTGLQTGKHNLLGSSLVKLERAAGAKRVSRWNSGVCSVCGKWVECITQEHANEHGYKNADEMARAGVVK